jgi:membrane-bound ClpP family serine protease
VDWLLDQPSVVLVLVTFAAALFIIEVALPTVGIAGALGLAASALAIYAIADHDMTWWPLVGPALGVVLWAVMIATQHRSPLWEVVAAIAFGLGGAAFAIVNEDVASMVVTVIATAGLALAFPRLHDAATRLARRPPQVGMEALVGGVAIVDRWDRTGGVVLLEGSRWNAAASRAIDLAPGDHVTVVGFHGNTVDVWPPPGPPEDRWTA